MQQRTSSKLHVLRIIGEIGCNLGTGPAKQAYLLTRGLAMRGVCSTILTYNTDSLDTPRLVSLRVYRPLLRIRSFLFSLRMLGDSLKAGADLVHVHEYRNFPTDVGAITSLFKDIPLVITSHGSVCGYALGGWSPESRKLPTLYDRLTARFALRRAHVTVATSPKEASELIWFGIPSSKVRIVPNSVTLPLSAGGSVRPTHKGKLRLLVVTRITYVRNLELALEGFALALRANKNMTLDIVGDEKRSSYTAPEEIGYKENLQKLCVSWQIRENVNFAGWLFGKELMRKYEDADIFLWTSRYDNFATELVEAASFGLPIISTDVGIASEIVDGGRGGLMVSSNPSEIAEAILTLAANSTLRAEMGLHNMEKARVYSPERMTDMYLRIYTELLDSRNVA